MMTRWLSAEEYAALAGISVQAARKRFRNDLSATTPKYQIRLATGRGGRSGTKYEVAASSLPEPIKTALIGLSEDTKSVVPYADPAPYRVPAPNQSQRVNYRWRVIEEAAEFPPRSAERAAEIRRASKKWGESIRTIQRWLRELEITGGDSNALARRKPSDAGRKRVVVTRQFDKAYHAAGYPADLLPELAARVDQLLIDWWASPAQRHGWKRVELEVRTAFARECRERGFELPRQSFRLSRYKVSAHERYREVDIYQHDRKRWDDAKPRIRRDNSKFGPMEQIVMDVKPLDCIVRRPDGSTTWPKMIGFMDTGTHRIFTHFVLLNPGEGIRQEHVIDAFIAMVRDPDWGFPQQLYRDNGTEFAMFDRIRDALALVSDHGARTVVNAKPYSGASKPIESKFATLDRAVFSQMAGWAGGNRLNKKTQTVGKPPAPYPGSFEAFEAEARERIRDFEGWEIGSGPFKGRSPLQIYIDHVDAGWRPARIDPLTLDAAFAKQMERRVDRGAIKIEGDRYRHPELPNRGTVTIALPYRRGAMPVVNLPELGWAYLEPEMQHLPGEVAGAIDAGRMQARADKQVRKMRRTAGLVDAAANRFDRVTALPTRAAPAPLIDVYLSDEARAMGKARREAEQRRLDAPTDAERARARAKRITENLERAQSRGA